MPQAGSRSSSILRLVRALALDAFYAKEPERGSQGTRPARRAVQIRTLMEQLGPFYVKLGQMLSTRPDLVSAPLARELAGLHRSVRAHAFAGFEAVLDEEFGSGWRAELRDLDVAAPLGCASLAQVYRATRPDGTVAVVKIQRPGARARMLADMAATRRAARVVRAALPKLAEVIDLESMLSVLFDAMLPELDFRLEAENMLQATRAAEHFELVSVPTVLRASERVLVQGLAPGHLIGAPKAGEIDQRVRREAGRQLLAFIYRGYFTERMFHADPHPGNIFLDPEHGATLIDWGMVGRLDRNLSMLGLLILTSLAQNDAAGLAGAWIAMGRMTPWADVPAFREDMTQLVPRLSAASLEHLDFGAALTTVLGRSARRGIRTTPMIGLLGKSFANIEGSVRLIAPELSITEVFRGALAAVVRELAREAVSPEQGARLAVELLLGATGSLDQARAVLRDVAGHEATVRVGLLPGHGIGGEGQGSLSRYRAHLVFGAAAAWLVHREVHALRAAHPHSG
jgi:ubiquinone biosynthesis protein